MVVVRRDRVLVRGVKVVAIVVLVNMLIELDSTDTRGETIEKRTSLMGRSNAL